ncbi:MAG: AmmeMemoRadiSam system protein B [Nitrospirales bacterium]|nr:AmmeMemoRadiSam system protein B [Nitrospirales bacterium]
MTETVKDPSVYPTLRNLQYSPLKQGEEQYIVLWDPTGLSSEKLVIPLSMFYVFQFFDGEHSLDQVGGEYLKKYGEFLLPDRLQRLVADLEDKLFLEGDRCDQAKALAIETFRNAPTRPSVFAGKSYEAEAEKLSQQLDGFFSSKEGPDKTPSEHAGQRIKGVIAPSFDLKEAGPLYAWTYKELQEAETPSVFVLLGTCHAGLEGGIAVTGKDFETPLGVVPVNQSILNAFRSNGGESFFTEELAHAQEHSIEFQLPFLQHTIGRQKPISIVPILCAFPPDCLADKSLKELFDRVDTFLSLFKQAVAASGEEICVIASGELAHIGLRYGDRTLPTDFSFHRCMQTDLEMLKHVENLEPEAFAEFILKEGNARRISGFSTMFTMLKLIQAEKGQVLRYDRGITDQFNSTVTYASIAFY